MAYLNEGGESSRPTLQHAVNTLSFVGLDLTRASQRAKNLIKSLEKVAIGTQDLASLVHRRLGFHALSLGERATKPSVLCREEIADKEIADREG